MADDWQMTSTENWTDFMQMNMSDEEVADCVPSYLPTVAEAKEALGAYGVTLVVIGGVTTSILYLLFIEQLIFIFNNVHKVYRRHICWITSIYPFMTLMSVIAVVMPRGAMIASGIKTVYMCNGLSHFVDLTELMFGSEKIMLAKLRGTRFTVSTGPICCIFPCLPSIKITQTRMRVVKWMVWQLPYLQSIYFSASILWNIAESDEDGLMNPNKSYLGIQVINLLSFMCGVWALNILSICCKEQLQYYGYTGKAAMVRTCILVTKLQSFILDFLALFQIYPCYGPIVSSKVFKIVLEQSLYLLEMILLGPITYWQFRTLVFLAKNPSDLSSLPEFQEKSRDISTISKKSMSIDDISPNSFSNPGHTIIDSVDEDFVQAADQTIAIQTREFRV